MGSGEEPLVRLNIEEKEEIEKVDTNRVNLVRGSIDERVGVGVENRGEGIEDEASMVKGDLEGFGNGGGVETVGRGREEEEFVLEWD